MSDRILFADVYDFSAVKTPHGGPIGALGMYNAIDAEKDYFHPEKSVHRTKTETGFIGKFGILLRANLAYGAKEIKAFKALIRANKYKYIFLNCSLLGLLAKKFKKQKIVTVFHNVEISYLKDVSKQNSILKRIKRFLYGKLIKRNEKAALKYSEKIVVLNERDLKCLHRYYPKEMKRRKKGTAFIVPVTVPDNMSERDIELAKKNTDGPKKGLFVGSNLPPNYEGVKWFKENVADKIDCAITVIGKGFENCPELAGGNMKIIGAVDDVKKYFLDADFCVYPIFFGSGMKIKTCEALMYGKTIFATDEAFCGYDLDYERAGGLCNTAEEFIRKINSPSSKFNEYSRGVYIEKYSREAARKLFREILR